ncbi:NahK/ErcS family hybrid sensor histidine kinase/response regulator [Pseudomonas aeruginosa]|uniref:NahK/ErcS family hybrid sensor histidine kinase/response regulator n=1 Tax=Pseudomonas aeruginosa TaxID=287 RepID=UPI001048E979|nr:NahK/ErcS family hybrid sensor histidine kinase/response regulator [Pseudomonas aeruginosa]
MACISTRPSPGSPLADPVEVSVAELQARVVALEEERHKLQRINQALIGRIESSAAQSDEAYGAFQYSVVLAEQVRERTDALSQTMLELKASNQLLSDARLRAETAHQHLLDAIESISDAFVLFDPQQRIVLFNERFRALWIDSRARIGPGMRRAELHRLARSGGLIVEEQRGGDQQTLYRLRDERWLRMSERPTRDGGLAVLYSDVTEIKLSETARREQALAQKSHLLQRAVDNLSQGVAMVGADGVLELWNRRFLELCGLAPIAGHRAFAEVMAESELPLLTPCSQDSQGSPLSAREQRLFDGRVLEIRTHALPTGGFVNTFTDITERYRHAEALRASERWIRLITDQVPALIAYLSDELVYEFTLFVLIRDITERRRTAEALHQAYQNLEQRVRERTAELTTLNDQFKREIHERSQVEARLREAKREAEQANLSKTKFLAAVSHDLLQPLNAARLFTSALQERGSAAPDNEALVNNISHSLEDVENLLGTLVDISKLDAGVITPDIAPFELGELLGNLAAEYRQVAASEGLRLDFVACGALVRSDQQLLARILRNLLSNAIRYTPRGRVLLGCRRHRQRLSIEVWDTGVGIAADKLGEIFQEFKRGESQRCHQDRGLGLGLAIVDKIARMLGHRVRVGSLPGKGSCFAIEVPLARHAPRSRAEPLASADDLRERLRGSRVWVLDNDAAICAGMRTLLEAWGCRVVTALSEEDLARQVDNYHAEADLLIVDYHLDDQRNGVDAVAAINARRGSPLPALMITANYSNELKQQVRELGHTLMHKPVRPMKLKTALCHLLEREASV